MWMGPNHPPPGAGPQFTEPTAAVLDDARVSTGCTTAHFSSVPEVRSENMRLSIFFKGSGPQLHSKYDTHVQILNLQHNQGEKY